MGLLRVLLSFSRMTTSYVVPSWIKELAWKNEPRWAEAITYLRNITKEDKVAVLYDDDGDGLSAASSVIVGITRLRGTPPDFFEPFGHATSYIDDALPEKLRRLGITKLITVDRVVDQKPTEFLQQLESVCPVLVIDHHKIYNTYSSPTFIMVKPQIVWETEPSSFPTAILAYTLMSCVVDLSDRDWVPCIGITSDSAYPRWKIFVDEVAAKWELEAVKEDPFIAPFGLMSNMIFCTQILASYQLGEFLDLLVEGRHPNEVLNSGFRSLMGIVESEVEEWLERLKTEILLFPEIELALANVQPKHAIKSLLINKLSHGKYATWNLIILQDVVNGSRVTISARRQDHKVPMNDLLEQCVKEFPDANAGGHVPAAGGSIRKQDEEKFIENVKNNLRARYALNKKE